MESTKDVKAYDLMFITDATGSMGHFLGELRVALPQIFDLVQLTNLVERISVLAFRDYCDKKLIEWSGWSSAKDTENLTKFVENLSADGGGDHPEAVKTGLWEASKKVEKPTICIMYVDAPPHHKYNGAQPGDNYKKEVAALGENNSQWLNICELVRDHEMRVYPVFPDLHQTETYPFFVHLANITSGQCIEIGRSSVVRATIGILLNLAAVEFEYDKQCYNAKMGDDVDFYTILAEGSELWKKPITKDPVKIDVVEDLKLKIGNPVKHFQTSEEYRNLVFIVFERLLLPDRVIAFTYNTLFGKLWREICKQRKDPRREMLVEKLSNSVTTVSDSDRKLLQTFIDESYDNTAEIESILLPYGSEGPFYVIDHDEHMSRKVLFEIGLSCAPFAVQSVLKLLAGLRITHQKPSPECNLTYIPVNLPPKLKFKLLPHLITPGTMFTLRLSAIMASIAKISGSILRDDATTFLKTIKGKWIDFELPECNSVDFARLMMQIGEEALTMEEIKSFRALLMISSLKRSKANQIDVELAYSSYKTKRPDFKDECKKCKQWRSVTLLLDETCAMCLVGDNLDYLEPKTEVGSWMCECRKCLVHYAVYNKDALKCRAKCHFCRLGQMAPFVTCQLCKNKFLHQQSPHLANYTCAVCTENKGRVGEKYTSTIANYVLQNGAGFIGMAIDAKTFFDERNKVSKMSADEKLKAVRDFVDIAEDDFFGHTIANGETQKEVWNVKELQQQVLGLLSKLKQSQCMICFEDFPLDKLQTICGLIKNGCTIEACRKCLNSWYNQLVPGRICQPAQLVCCYCKRVPKIKVVRQYNRRLCTLMNTMDVTAFDPSYIYAWCIKCYEVKQAMPRECGREQQEIIDFKCPDCVITLSADVTTKECPKCKVLTEKHGGCNHIACENVLSDGSKCDAHWCWVCSALSTDSEIYIHLSQAHGGYFSPEDMENFDEEE